MGCGNNSIMQRWGRLARGTNLPGLAVVRHRSVAEWAAPRDGNLQRTPAIGAKTRQPHTMTHGAHPAQRAARRKYQIQNWRKGLFQAHTRQ